MHVEENQTEPAATGGGSLGTDVTSLTVGVEPSSSAAAGDRSLTNLNKYFSAACPGDIGKLLKVFMFLWRSQMVRDVTSKKKEAENFGTKPGRIPEIP